MTRTELTTSFDFDDDLVVEGGLDAVAAAIATHAATTPHTGIVVVIRPESDHPEVVSGGVGSALRAAVSVVAAAGNTRLWHHAGLGETTEIPTAAFPEVLRAAADGAGVTAAHVGIVSVDDGVDAVAIWFAAGDDVAPVGDRHAVLRMLTSAAERDIARAAEEAAVRAEKIDEADVPVERLFDADDPSLDPVTGLATEVALDAEIDAFDGDEAVVVVLQIDESDDLGDDLDDIVRIVADRLFAATRANDVVARLGDDRFAILIGGVERNDAMDVARRLHETIADPIALTAGTVELSSTMAFAHESGLPDVEELLESALAALEGSRRIGRGRFVLAA